ncbi:MAG: putative lipid II flippase FtsW [Sphingomonadales bacterium]|nr:putative lipid II flippase FtsW [Sphingomonadales bacterium]
MRIAFARSDNSHVSRWWWELDRWMFGTLLLLIAVGLLLTVAASPAVAERLGLNSFHFVKRQAVFMVMGIGGILFVSMLTKQWVRRLAVVLFPITLGLVYLTVFQGAEIKGATRWLQLGSFTLQPSEFLKPVFIVCTAWMFSEQFNNPSFPGKKVAVVLYLLVIGGLLMQPDYGQTFLISAVFLGQLVLAGLPVLWLGAFAGLGIVALVVAYMFVPHVQNRIDIFLDPASGDSYQIDTALNAFRAGGMFGRGPGEGAVKRVLPDAHTDYIFAVAGEEFGAILCLAIVALFAVIVIRGLSHLLEEENTFVVFAAGGLLALFGLQAFINLAVNLAILPAKGMTLPFVSYGGSSMLALSLTMGMVMALTRKNKFLKGKFSHTRFPKSTKSAGQNVGEAS